jgi:hypothetical protein
VYFIPVREKNLFCSFWVDYLRFFKDREVRKIALEVVCGTAHFAVKTEGNKFAQLFYRVRVFRHVMNFAERG